MKKRGRRVSAFLMAVLLVIGMMPMDWAQQVAYAATSFTGGEKVSDESSIWNGWTWSVFGNSAKVEKNTISEKGSSVTLASTGGKIAGSNDGIDYLYYELASNQNVTLTAKATIDVVKADKQVGFGLMLRSAVGEHGDTAEASPLNSAFVGGVYKSAAEYYNANEKNPKNNYLGEACTVELEQGNTYDLCIQKVADVVTLSMEGVVIDTVPASEVITGDTMYIGMFAARNITVTYSDVTLSYSDNSAVSVDNVTKPTKTQYIVGNTYKDIDLTGFSAEVTVGSEKRTITAKDCRIDNFNFDVENENTAITLDYFGEKIELPIKVIKEVVNSVEVLYNPVKTDYEIGSTQIDWTGFEGEVVYNSGVVKKLEELIAEEDYETVVEYDFSKAGNTTIKITHTHGDVAKSVEIPVVVSDASVTELEIMNQPNETEFYVGQETDENSGKSGLMIKVDYSDGSSRIISSGFTITADASTGELDTSKAGTYTYNVSYSGKTVSYSVVVKADEIEKLEITAYPTKTTYVKNEEFTSEGIQITRVLKSGDTEDITKEVKIDSTAFDNSKTGDYKINISYVWSDNKTYTTDYTVSVRDKIAYNYDDIAKQYGWNSVVFGQSTADGIEAEVKDKVITIESKEGVGKCTDDGQDGITYYYTAINPQTDNFEMTAKVKVDYFITKSAPDNQEGFGIMVRDSIGTDGDSSIYLSNAMSVGGYYGRYNVFGRYNIASQSEGGNRINVTKYSSKMKDLTYQIKEDEPKTFELTLKKDNTGVYATMKDEEGNIVENIDGSLSTYLPADTFSVQEPDKMYIGFMTARGAKIEVDTSTISMTVTSVLADEPQQFAPEKPVSPTVSMNSITETGDEDYTVTVNVNTAGLLTVKNLGEAITSQEYVTAGTYNYPTKLITGDNKIQLYFEPDATFNITSAEPVSANYTVLRTVYQPDSYIYVSPDGTPAGDGSKENPVDIQSAITFCEAGQGIYMLEGTYNLSTTTGIFKGNNGTKDAPKTLKAAPENKGDVIIDFAKDKKATGSTFDISGDYWIIDGLKILNGGGVRVGGNHNIVMNCDFAGHTNSGLSISRTDGSNNKEDWPSYNEIISCNAYFNRDASDNNADGFAAKLTCGVGNVFKYCVAAFNADDGWDLFSKTANGPIGEVKIYDSLCYGNGFYIDENGEVKATAGDGNGFKMGGSGIEVMHEAYGCVSFGNKTNGFTNNSDPMGKYIDCIGYNNGGSNLELHVYTGAEPQFTVTNFKSYADATYQNISTDIEQGDLTKSEAEEACINTVKAKNNFFYNAKTGKSTDAEGNELTEYDFVSVSELVDFVKGGIASVKRDSEGKLDLGNFLKVRELTALKETISEAEKLLELDNSKYTQSSVEALTNAVENAKAVVSSHDTQDVIDNNTQLVKDAIAGLVIVTTEPTFDFNKKDNAPEISVVGDKDALLNKVLTSDELASIKNGAKLGVDISVEGRKDGVTVEEKKLIESVLKNNEVIATAFDINISKSINGNVSAVNTTNGELTFKLSLAKELINTDANINRTYSVVRIHDGKAEIVTSEFDSEAGTITFNSDKFSVFAVVYSDKNINNSENNGSNDNNNSNNNNANNDNANDNNANNTNNVNNNNNNSNANGSNTSSNSNTTVKDVQTGDTNGMYIPVFVMLMLISAGAIFVILKKKKVQK